MKIRILICGLGVAAIGAAGITFFAKGPMKSPIAQIRVRIPSGLDIPDPAKIELTGDWYLLDHLSSGLAGFDNQKKKFEALLAESWSIASDGTHVFKLRPGVRFHDGSAITTKDVLWSIKRILMLKTSTHFPLWDYIEGCENLKSLDQECTGLREISSSEVGIKLKERVDSFFLQLASPETGIWAASDMDPKTGRLTPTKFSGPYYATPKPNDDLLVRRNEQSPVVAKFPDAPKSILFKKVALPNVDQALSSGEIDVVIRDYRPMGEPDWKKQGVSVFASAPSTLVYLQGTGANEARPAIGKDFVRSAWKENTDEGISPGASFLPFAGSHGLVESEFLSQLPEHTAKQLRVLCPEGYFSESFLNLLRKSAHAVGADIAFSFLKTAEYFTVFDDPKAAQRFDYILTTYAASERYPAVQLRYITGSLPKPNLDLKKAESPELNPAQVTLLRDYQKWLLTSRTAVPLFFMSNLILSRGNIDIGDQPSTDAEVELWRVKARAP